jgi:hypothetical protein
MRSEPFLESRARRQVGQSSTAISWTIPVCSDKLHAIPSNVEKLNGSNCQNTSLLREIHTGWTQDIILSIHVKTYRLNGRPLPIGENRGAVAMTNDASIAWGEPRNQLTPSRASRIDEGENRWYWRFDGVCFDEHEEKRFQALFWVSNGHRVSLGHRCLLEL